MLSEHLINTKILGINVRLRMLLLGIAVSQALNLTSGCVHANAKRVIKIKHGEVWSIDQTELTLFRFVGESKEQIIPIPDNKEMNKFVCMDSEYFEFFISDRIN